MNFSGGGIHFDGVAPRLTRVRWSIVSQTKTFENFLGKYLTSDIATAVFELTYFVVRVTNVWNTLPVDCVDFPLLLHLNRLHSRLSYRCFIMLLGLCLFLGYYQLIIQFTHVY